MHAKMDNRRLNRRGCVRLFGESRLQEYIMSIRYSRLAVTAVSLVVLVLLGSQALSAKKAPKPPEVPNPKKPVKKTTASDGPVKVFLLVGQSNMQGKGSVKHLDELVKKEPAVFGHLQKDGKWVERDDVGIYFGSMRSRNLPTSGPLTVGYTYPPGRMGPEMGFGKVIGDAIDQPVILIKACWGGQSLAVDFRPPSRGKWDRQFNRDDGKKYKPATVGWAYKEIFNIKHFVLDNMDATFPQFAGRKYQIAGLVWFQGWNDLINGKRTAEYAENMTAFIKDIRKHLETPNLPIVIGVAGHGGNANVRQKKFRDAQSAPAKMPEFKGSVAAVPTAPYWDDTVKHDGGYHYNGSARFYYRAGEAFGKAMLGLLKTAGKQTDRRNGKRE